ncbi:hypothetical protein [Roseateles sp. MS654]|uniref:hypothetical protein n=1 Tax=Roseateles sp. MS654 TaxID=3412685 RepID=UPI003C2F28A3
MAQLSVQAHPPLAYPDAGAIDTTQEGLDKFDPQQHPEMKTALLTEAQLFYRAERLRPHADPDTRKQIDALLHWADQLQQHPSPTAYHVYSLALSLQHMPPELRSAAGHLGACDSAQAQLDRFRKDLESPATNARPAARNSPDLLRKMEKTQRLINEVRRLLDTGELSPLQNLVKTIQENLRDLRGVPLAHKGKVAPTYRLGRSDVRAAAKQLSQLAQPLRADAVIQKLLAASQELSDLEAQVTDLGSKGAISKQERTWALTTRRGLLRKERPALDEACKRFKDDAAGCNKAEAVIASVRDRIAIVRKQLHNPQLR